MKTASCCSICGRTAIVSSALGVCVDCLRENPDEAVPKALSGHGYSRRLFGLPATPPKTAGGIPCNLCAANCSMGVGEKGYCGLRMNFGGRLISKTSAKQGLLHYYLDPHVTNCCNAYFCPAGTGKGYPKYACKPGPETGYHNLALFFYGCSLNCLFCQNWSHKKISESPVVGVDELVTLTLKNSTISCWCWFGGSAEPQLPFAINASKAVHESKPSGRVLRICYEWNGDGNPWLVKKALETVVESGGNVKFDLKAFDPNVHMALTGLDNSQILRNFEMVYREYYDRRADLPVLAATTLLVPGYVDKTEVAKIAEFIASLNPEIPYSLLIFHPDFMMKDLPITPRSQVVECYTIAKKRLKNVHIGNIHLLAFA
ncbi:MAG: radical SAM protein [Candidatus Caldarchaeum sp.]|nr:radical SAM protein [Candidatus Caldarchaeum sp.]